MTSSTKVKPATNPKYWDNLVPAVPISVSWHKLVWVMVPKPQGGKFNGTFYDNGAIALQPAIAMGAEAEVSVQICENKTSEYCSKQ